MKNVLYFILIILSFLFFPKENRWFLFHSSKESFYGEIYMIGNKDKYIFAKNTSDYLVHIKKNLIKSNLSEQIDNGHCFYPDSPDVVYPNSYSIINVAGDSNKTDTERNYDNNYNFTPMSLEILTKADRDYKFITYLFLGSILGWLVYLVTSFTFKSKGTFNYD
jgi:hypothetical protein